MKVAAFLIALAAAFGIAVAAGATLGPEPAPDAPAPQGRPMDGHGNGSGAAMPAAHGTDAPRGLATADDGLRLVVATPELERGSTGTLRFRIVDARDCTVRDFDLGHEQRMHFTRDGEARTLASDLRVDGDADLRPLPVPASTAASDGGETVRLDAERPRAGRETTLRFAVVAFTLAVTP